MDYCPQNFEKKCECMAGFASPLSTPIKTLDVADEETLIYPEIGVSNFNGALWTFKQWTALKIWVHYWISSFS